MEAATADDALDIAKPKPAAGQIGAGAPADGDGKWPLATRVIFIAGSAAALWGLIWLGYKAL